MYVYNKGNQESVKIKIWKEFKNDWQHLNLITKYTIISLTSILR